jgi:hypothetical protein
MTKKLRGSYKGNVGSLLGNIYLNPSKKKTTKYKRKILEVRPSFLKDDYSDLLDKKVTVVVANDARLNLISEMRKKEDRTKGKQTLIEEGFVYLVKNSAFPGWIKAGMTIDYEDRLKTYNLYAPDRNFQMISMKWVADRRVCETILLEELGKIAEITNGEWFKVDESLALKVFNS